MSTYSKILIPIDFSEYSEEALRQACDLARRFDSELHLLHVLDSVVPLAKTTTEFQHIYRAFMASRSAEAEQSLRSLPPRSLGPKPVVRNVLIGNPAVEIVKYADDNGIELIVMGTHGRTGFKAWMAGSVAERVVRFAHCPVLVVRPYSPAVSGAPSARSA
jgi:nucleotide-binding universal stress UspA family protein